MVFMGHVLAASESDGLKSTLGSFARIVNLFNQILRVIFAK